ncbi:MAG: DUF6456 domain-containing protein [Hyphomonadaceae bacterium]
MSEGRIARALAQLAKPGAVMAPCRNGVFGVYPRGDRRRRPAVRLSAQDAKALESDGAIAPREDGGYVLTSAGWARVRRQAVLESEAFAAQHVAIEDRAVIDDDGATRMVRGLDPDAVMRRLANLKDAAGRSWFDAAELAAANRLRRDWALVEIGMLRGSDWTAAPIGAAPRGAANAQEAAMARRCDARKRVAGALERLAPPLRRVVERVCLHEVGLDVLERTEAWPQRSGKLALKLGLAQLAAVL